MNRACWLVSIAVFLTGRFVAADNPPVPLDIYGVSHTEERAAVVRFTPGTPAKLTVLQSIPLSGEGAAVAHHPRHDLVYTACRNSAGAVHRRRPDGTLTKVRDVEFHTGYCWLGFDQTARWLLAASYQSGAVDVIRLDEHGLPTELADSHDVGRKMAHALGVSADNRFAYAGFVKESNGLFQFAFDAATGRLTPLVPPTVEIPADLGPRHLVFHPRLPIVYFSGEQQLGVAGFPIGPDGRLGPPQLAAPPQIAPAKGLAGSDIVITPDGRFLFVGIRGFEAPLQAVASYAIDAEGRVRHAATTETDAIPWALDVAPDGSRLFVSAARSGTLTSFVIGPDGGLQKEAAVDLGKDFWDIVVAPTKAAGR